MELRLRLRDLFVGPAKSAFIELFRSLFVGAAAFAGDFVTLTLLKEAGGVSTLLSATLGFVVGVVINYILSAFWAFRNSNIKSGVIRFAVFVVIAIVGLLLNNLIIAVFDGPIAENMLLGEMVAPKRYYMIGKIVATIIVFFWNFFSRKLLLFRSNAKMT